MNIVLKKVDEIHECKSNSRIHPELQLKELKRSFEMFGQYRPLVVTSDGEIIVGNGLYAALKDSVSEFECIVLPENTPEKYKKKLMLCDNKVYALGADNLGVIDEIFNEMKDFDVPGFNQDVLEELYSSSKEALESIDEMFTIPQERKAPIISVQERRDSGEIYPKKNDKTESAYDASTYVSNQSEEKSSSYINCPHRGMKIYL